MVCLTVLNRSVIPLCWNFGGRTFECPFVGRLGFSEPHSHDIQPQGFSVWASVSLLSHPPKSHARFSFGVKLNLTIFLLESEIPSPLHFCGAPSIERTHLLVRPWANSIPALPSLHLFGSEFHRCNAISSFVPAANPITAPPSLHSFGSSVNSIHPRRHLFIRLAAR